VKQFSHGKFGYNHKRKIRITRSQYSHARLKCSDSRFASDPQYIFALLNWIEKETILSTINIAERKRKQVPMKAGQIINRSSFKSLLSDKELYACFKTIRGTPQYFREMTLDILAKIRQYGPPTFFMTFSAAEFKWTDIIKIVAKQFGENLDDETINNMSWSTKVKYLKLNPVTVARQIDYWFNCLWKNVVMSGLHPIGQVLNYDDRREYQDRGAQHMHVTVHIEGAPQFDESSDEKITAFIDRYITCEIPNSISHKSLHDTVISVQKHNHTNSCLKGKQISCRYNAPWPPTLNTLIIRSNSDKKTLNKSKKVLKKVFNEISSLGINVHGYTVNNVLERINITYDEYKECLLFMSKSSSILYKRKPSEVLIVPYNTVLLNTWQGNMNIQFVTGIYGVIMYLTSYLCKPERTISELMNAASKEATSLPIREKLLKIGNVFQRSREVSLHQAIALTISIPLRHSNIDVIFVPTGPKEMRTRIIKPGLIKGNANDPETTDIYCPNLLDKYSKRPDDLEDLCLADFASNYSEFVHNPKIDDE